MKLFYTILPFLFFGSSYFSQTTIHFQYDEAGNQKYRGPISTEPILSSNGKEANIETLQKISEEEEQFWREIRIYPVPVKDILTIDWTDEANELIESVSLYEHNTIHWKFQAKNLPHLNKQVKVNMNDYYIGIYILRFQLKNGKIYSRNIIKL